MNQSEIELWKKIEAFELDDLESPLTFSARLARDNRWTTTFALQAIQEYKKFMFLICTANHPLTPSPVVDEVWHLHLLYTQSYWKEFCQETLGREIHHGPTRGGKQEAEKFNNWYTVTINLYSEKFLRQPPLQIWPTVLEKALSSQVQKIDGSKYWIIKKPYK
jgi:hypothetical protein